MSNVATMKLVVLFEDEMRVVAKATKAFLQLPDDATDQQQAQAASEVLKACYVAFDGADEDDACLLLGKKPVGITS